MLFVFKRGPKVPQMDPTNGIIFLYISQASAASGKRSKTDMDGQQP